VNVSEILVTAIARCDHRPFCHPRGRCVVTPEEQSVRRELGALASSDRGRQLLQLSLRGIARGKHKVTAGCWVDAGIAGCLFQHAYWQGVEEGIFADEGRPGDWVGGFVGSSDYGIVVSAIAAFDLYARTTYADVQRRRLLPDRVTVRMDEWRSAVERLLVETLADAERTSPRREEVTATA
jgi:hypothetical protein